MVGFGPTTSGSPRRRATRLRYTLSISDISRHRLSRKSWRDEQALPLQGPLSGLDRFPSGCRHSLGLPSRTIVPFPPALGGKSCVQGRRAGRQRARSHG
jgi:hypothetical protein